MKSPVLRRGLSRAMPSAETGGRILAPIVPLVIVVYMFLLLPIETRPQVFGVSLPISRLGILAFTPFMLARFAGGRTRPILADWVMILAAAWILISFCLLYGLGEGAVRGMGVVIDTGGAYLLARLAITDSYALRRFLIMISPGLFFAGLVMMAESVTHQLFYRSLFAAVFGQALQFEAGEAIGQLVYTQEVRLGLMRSYGPFSHPILGGVILTSLLPLWLLGGIRSWPKWLGIASALMGLFSLSSAAMLGLALGLLLVATDRAKRYFTGISWPLVAAFAFAGYVLIEMLSNRSFSELVAQFTLNPQTAYYRLLIWEHGSKSVAEHPWIGIGYFEWVRPAWMGSSVDAHFLALAMRNGLPLLGLMLATIVLGLIGTGARAAFVGGRDRDLMVGLNLSMVVLLFDGLTVTYFNEANVFVMIMIGIVASFSAGLRFDQSGSLMLDMSGQRGLAPPSSRALNGAGISPDTNRAP